MAYKEDPTDSTACDKPILSIFSTALFRHSITLFLGLAEGSICAPISSVSDKSHASLPKLLDEYPQMSSLTQSGLGQPRGPQDSRSRAKLSNLGKVEEPSRLGRVWPVIRVVAANPSFGV